MKRVVQLGCLLAAVISGIVISSPYASAEAVPTSDFSLEVSPSPLSVTVEPGKKATVELKIRNASLQPENLRIETRSFRIAYPDQNIIISNTTPPDLAQWVTYSNPVFTVPSKEWFNQQIDINLPEAAGFSYPFVVVVSRANDTATNSGGQLLRGSIAVFALVNINKPGATRQLEVESVLTDKASYEYLPATVKVKLKNTGNSIVQPYGNIYIQRGNTDDSPLAVLALNDAKSYILPGNSREVTATWSDGFPVIKKDDSGKQYTDWSLSDAGDFRFGQYTAKVVAVYNDGVRDMPITGSTTFWVLPWKILLVGLIIIVLIGIGIWSTFRRITTGVKTVRTKLRS